MSVDKFSGTSTLGGHFRWETIHEENNWKVQHHKKKFLRAGSKPYRLLDPRERLMASADTEEEIIEYLNQIIKH